MGLAEHHASSGREAHQLEDETRAALDLLEPIEIYWAFPGPEIFQQLLELFRDRDYAALSRQAGRIVRALVSGSYRHRRLNHDVESRLDEADEPESSEDITGDSYQERPYFEVMVVDHMSERSQNALRRDLHHMRRSEDAFIYEAVIVPSLEDALIAALVNPVIQAVVIRYDFPLKSRNTLWPIQRELRRFDQEALREGESSERGLVLAQLLSDVRPELDIYLVTDLSVEEIAVRLPRNVRRVFYQQEDYLELHLNLLRGVNRRYRTPFFAALREYSRQPTGVFHAMPISRGKSISKSNWIRDMGEFYGMNIFLAETSATSGGLDSLLDPTGPIKEAQEAAARAFHAERTFFVTNGTSTANKIVVQAILQPGDIVLVDRDCHKSHHYGLVLAGAEVVYLDSYPLNDFSMYGAVPLREIKRQLLKMRDADKLHRVKLLLLTNCTFDGIVYNVQRVMEECLALNPNLVFLWDEAWFAFASMAPTYRQRTAMWSARKLRERLATDEHREAYKAQAAELAEADEETLLNTRLLPDPSTSRIRVYATQSTHKTLTALRQGSMIHVCDQDFKHLNEDAFHEAYMTHTSTSPNYQILASLDIGRRQVQLEGFELVEKQVELAMILRERVHSHPLLSKYFRFLGIPELIPSAFRESGVDGYYDADTGWSELLWESWANDEFVLDPSRLTLYIGATGIEGNEFKDTHLMNKYGIQINKTSRNTVLFMTNIGTTRSSVAYLIKALVAVATEIDKQLGDMSRTHARIHDQRIKALTSDLPPLPDFSYFHDRFRINPKGMTSEGNIRSAFFLSYDEMACEYLGLFNGEIDRAMAAGWEVVSAMFVIPYPPGFPILVPGQVVSMEILEFMRALDVKEIHGYRPEFGLRVFTEEVLQGARTEGEVAE